MFQSSWSFGYNFNVNHHLFTEDFPWEFAFLPSNRDVHKGTALTFGKEAHAFAVNLDYYTVN